MHFLKLFVSKQSRRRVAHQRRADHLMCPIYA